MSNQLSFYREPAGLTKLVIVFYNDVSLIRASNGALVADIDGNLAVVAVPMSDTGHPRNYIAVVPAGTAAGELVGRVFLTAGSTLVRGDMIELGSLAFTWNGTSIISGAGSTGTGTGDVLVTQDTGGTDTYRVMYNSLPVDGAQVYAYSPDAYVPGGQPDAQTVTGSDGRWISGLFLDPGAYKLVFVLPGHFQTTVLDLTVS